MNQVYCSPPDTVVGIETATDKEKLDNDIIVALLIPLSVLKQASSRAEIIWIENCSPPDTVVGIETPKYIGASFTTSAIVALLIPLSVLKPAHKLAVKCSVWYCSPPDTVVGIETSR